MTGARVAFDVTVARTNRMGSGLYARRLSAALRPLMGDRLAAIDCHFAASYSQHKTARDRLATFAHDVWWTQHATLSAAYACDARLLHMPATIAPIRSALPVVVTIHDLAVFRFPSKFRRWHRTWVSMALPRVVQSVHAIVACSQATKRDVVELLDVDPNRVSVIHHGIHEGFSPLPADDPRLQSVRARYGLPRDYLITVGAVEPRKNLVRLLHALARLRDEKRTLRDLHLLHVGPVGWLAGDVPATVARLGLSERVRFLGYVPDEDLSALYQLARGSVYPSLLEGFGFPVLESMASGCPVVTSSCSSMPEVAGDAAILVDPTSVDSIAEGVVRVWEDDVLRENLRDRGLKRAATFTWEATARRTMRLYDSVLASA